jgi:NADP-dependent 3-hydroxy acid dehydrogenase YdfG
VTGDRVNTYDEEEARMALLTGKTAIVTGGYRGYGSGIAEKLKKNGAVVWITGRNEKDLEATGRRLGLHAMRADAASASDWDALVEKVIDECGSIDILVNNAGGGVKIAPLDEQNDEDIETSIGINLTGAVMGCRRVVPFMKKQKSGTIVNVSSVCAKEAWPGWSIYSAAKAGMVQFSQCLYTELREYGVRVTSLIPSWGATNFLAAADLPGFDAETAEAAIQPGELGELVVTICALPPHLNIEELTLWPLVQKIEPL